MKQREPYEAKAKTDKQRYEEEKASYNVSIAQKLLSLEIPVANLFRYRQMMTKKRRNKQLSSRRRRRSAFSSRSPLHIMETFCSA